MKLFEQEDDKQSNRKNKKIMRRMKHKRERKGAKIDPEKVPTYKKYKGWVL